MSDFGAFFCFVCGFFVCLFVIFVCFLYTLLLFRIKYYKPFKSANLSNFIFTQLCDIPNITEYLGMRDVFFFLFFKFNYFKCFLLKILFLFKLDLALLFTLSLTIYVCVYACVHTHTHTYSASLENVSLFPITQSCSFHLYFCL